MSHYPDSFHRSSHLLAATVVSFWLTTYQLLAQAQETAFGCIRSLPTAGQFERFRVIREDGQHTTIYLWNAGATRLSVISVDSTLAVTRRAELVVDQPFDDIIVPDPSRERQYRAVLIHRTEKRLSFVTRFDGDTVRAAGSLQLSVAPSEIALGDLNNDQRTDLLIYDRDNPGILPFFGTGGMRFRKGATIAPDNAVSELVLVHLNNDNLLDFIFYDWVRSELHLMYGVGQGKFLDQTTFPVEGELKQLVILPMTPVGFLDFTFFSQNPSLLEVWAGNGLGDFQQRIRMPLKEAPVSIAVGDLNGDGYKDIVALNRSSLLEVFLGAGMETPPERVDFASGRDVRDLKLQDVNRDGSLDAVVLDREEGDLVVYLNGQTAVRLEDSLEYVTGLRPLGVWIQDVTADGLNDVALVDQGSNALSVFANTDDRGLHGQTAYPLSSSPSYLGFHSLRDSMARYLISYPETNRLSFLTIDQRDRTQTDATIPTAGETEFLAWDGTDREYIDFFCFNWASSTGAPSLTLFQQIGSETFIERSFRLSIPNALVGAAVGDLNGDGRQDVAYVYRSSSTAKYEFAISLGDTAYSFKQKTFSYDLPWKQIEKGYLWITDLTRDAVPDVLISLPRNEQVLVLARGKGDGTFAPPDTLTQDIAIADRGQLRIFDFDRDGLLDILVNDSVRHSVGWLRGKEEGGFVSFRELVGDRQIGNFAVGDLNGDGIPDLAVTLTEKGTLKIFDGPTLRRMQSEEVR